MSPCVFFDRDGIVNIRLPDAYVRIVDEFVFRDDFFPFYERVLELNVLRVVVSNQQGVGKGLMSHQDLDSVHHFMQQELLRRYHRAFDAIYTCTDLAAMNSPRRKPEPGMLLDAARDLNIDLTKSWMVGDSPSDVTAGKRAGCRTILVSTLSTCPDADIIVPDLNTAATFLH